MGGIWAVSAQPAFSRRGFATQLMKEAHNRMRAAGLQFSTLGTRRSLAAHRMYRQLGYEDVHIAGVSISEISNISLETELRLSKQIIQLRSLWMIFMRGSHLHGLGLLANSQDLFPC